MPPITLHNGETLNAAHVVKFQELHDGRHQLGLTDGSTAYGYAGEVEEAFQPIVPAAAGYVACRRKADTWHFHIVVAWRGAPGTGFLSLQVSTFLRATAVPSFVQTVR